MRLKYPLLIKELIDIGSSLIRIKDWDILRNYEYNAIIDGDYVYYIDKNDYTIRVNDKFVELVEKWGDNAGYEVGGIKVIDVPDCDEWKIKEDYGIESVIACGKRWY